MIAVARVPGRLALGVTVSTTQVRSSGAQLAKLGNLLAAGTVRAASKARMRWQMREGRMNGRPVGTSEERSCSRSGEAESFAGRPERGLP